MAPKNYSDFVVKTPFTAYAAAINPALVSLADANDIAIYPFNMPYPMEVTSISVEISTGDGSNNSDVGIYDFDGNLLGHIGAQHISSGVLTAALTDGPIVIGPGTYLLAFTSAGTTLAWATPDPTDSLSLCAASDSTSSGGALPSTIVVETSINEGRVSPFSGFPPVMILS